VVGINPALAKNLADGAVGLAAKRYSTNPSGVVGARLFQFAMALDPTNENLLYLKTLIGLGRPIDPAVIPVKVTDEQYTAYLLQLAKMQPPSYFRLLLYNVVSVLNPTQRVANIELQRARERDVVADFDGVIKRLPNTFPPRPSAPPASLLPASTAKSLADGAVKLAGRKFQIDGHASLIGANLLQFAAAIDPANDSTLFMKALCFGKQSLAGIDLEINEEAYFASLKENIQGSENETVKLLLHHLSLIKNQADRDAILSLQQAQLKGRNIKFQALIDSLNRQTLAANHGKIAPGAVVSRGVQRPEVSLDERLKHSQLRDNLTSRKWMLHSVTEQKKWFFEFRSIGVTSNARGTCKGLGRNEVHTWKEWEFHGPILLIDGNKQFKYDDRLRQWVQANGGRDMYFR